MSLLPNGTMVDEDPFVNCTGVWSGCPVEATIYGYRPNLGANLFFVIWFSMALLVSIYQGFRYKSWWFNGWIIAGSAGEIAGYAGRVAMHYNPWNNDAFMDQIATLIFSPVSVFFATIYSPLTCLVILCGCHLPDPQAHGSRRGSRILAHSREHLSMALYHLRLHLPDAPGRRWWHRRGQ